MLYRVMSLMSTRLQWLIASTVLVTVFRRRRRRRRSPQQKLRCSSAVPPPPPHRRRCRSSLSQLPVPTRIPLVDDRIVLRQIGSKSSRDARQPSSTAPLVHVIHAIGAAGRRTERLKLSLVVSDAAYVSLEVVGEGRICTRGLSVRVEILGALPPGIYVYGHPMHARFSLWIRIGHEAERLPRREHFGQAITGEDAQKVLPGHQVMSERSFDLLRIHVARSRRLLLCVRPINYN
jgi:hypothetical protein